jgi:hypothetical protein
MDSEESVRALGKGDLEVVETDGVTELAVGVVVDLVSEVVTRLDVCVVLDALAGGERVDDTELWISIFSEEGDAVSDTVLVVLIDDCWADDELDVVEDSAEEADVVDSTFCVVIWMLDVSVPVRKPGAVGEDGDCCALVAVDTGVDIVDCVATDGIVAEASGLLAITVSLRVEVVASSSTALSFALSCATACDTWLCLFPLSSSSFSLALLFCSHLKASIWFIPQTLTLLTGQ